MPTTYIDDHIEISSGRLTIRTRSRTREVPLTDVRSARLINLGINRHRIVGIGPTRPRTWFTLDRDRRHQQHAIELDTGRILRIGITPDDPHAALDAITEFISAAEGEKR